MQQQDDALARFDRLMAGKKKSGPQPADDALAEFDRLTARKPAGAPTGPSGTPQGIDLGNPPARPSTVKPAAGREPPKRFDWQEAAGGALSRKTEQFEPPPPPIDRTDTRKAIDVRRRTGDLKPVVIEADPEKVTVSRKDRVKRDWAPAVRAETQAGFERQAAGQPTDLTRPKAGKRNFNAEALRSEAQAARDRAERLRLTGRPEDTNAADDLEARAYNTELLVDRIQQTDTFGAIAMRNATFGLSDADKTREITDIKERDLALSEEDQSSLGRESAIGYERPFSASKELGAPMAGQIVPMIATTVAGRALALGVGRMALARGMTRTASIAERLGTVIEAEPMLGPRQRGIAGAGEKFSEFLRVAPTAAKRGAIEGNLFSAATEANIARERGDPNWGQVGVESYVMGAGMGAVAEVGLAGIGKFLGGTGDVVKDALRRYPPNIAKALEIAATPPDHLPLADKMPDAQAQVISKLAASLDQHLADRTEAEPPVVSENYRGVERRRPTAADDDERYAVDTHARRERRRQWESQRHEPDFVAPPRRVWGQEERDAFHAEQVRKQGPYSGLPEPIHPDEAEKIFSRGAAEEFPYQTRERLAREAQAPPEAQPTLVDNFDMSKNLDRIEAERVEAAALAEQERVVAEAEARGEVPPPRTPEERLARAKARYGKITKDVPIKKIAFGTAAAAAAAQDEDNAGPAAIAAAVALGVNRVDLGELRLRFNQGELAEDVGKRFGLSAEEVRRLAEARPSREEVERRLALRHSMKEIGKDYGIGPEAVREIRLTGSHGAAHDLKGRDRAARDAQVAAAYARGSAEHGIAQAHNISKGDVRRIVREQGGEVRPDAARDAELERQTGRLRGPYLPDAAKKAIVPAALAAGAGASDDEDTKLALAGAAVLSTGRIHDIDVDPFYSRIVAEVGRMSGSWREPRAAGDWLGKLGSSSAFGKEEFNRVLKPWLEKAKTEKRKVTRDEVLEQVQKGAFKLALARRGEGGRTITSPKPEPPPSPPVVRQAPHRTELDWQDIEGAEEGEGYNVLLARQERAEEKERAQSEYDEAEEKVGSERESLWNVVENAGVSRRIFDNALSQADDGEGGLDQSRFMDHIRDYVDQPQAEGYDAPTLGSDTSYSVVEAEDADGETIYKVTHYYEGDRVRGVGFTKLEALAEHQNVVGNDQLGNLNEILGSQTDYKVEQHPDGGLWAIIDGEDGEIVMEGRTREEVVQAWVDDKYDGSNIEPPENGDLDTIDSYADDYARALSQYNETESETYILREGDDGDEFEERLDEARQEDQDEAEEKVRLASEEAEAARAEREAAPILAEPPWDEDFYELTEAERERVREGIRRGAVGTRAPFMVDEPEHGGTHHALGDLDFIFDPSIPHTPFPRERATVLGDPKQINLFGGQPFTLPARAPTIIQVTGETKFHGSQRVPGGSNYREVTFVWSNPPGSLPPELAHRVERIPGGGNWRVLKPDGTPASGQTHYYKSDAREELGRIHDWIAADNGLGSPVNFIADHYAGDPPNVQVWSRMDEHTYVEGGAVHPAVRGILDERAAVGKELGEIAAEFETMVVPGDPPPTPATATPAMLALARRLQDTQAKVDEIDARYNAAVQAGHGPGTYKEIATNIVEAQSDLKQAGESGGYYSTDPITPQRRAAITTERAAIRAEKQVLSDDFDEHYDDFMQTERGRRLEEIRDIVHLRRLTPNEMTEYNTLGREQQAHQQGLTDDHSSKASALDARDAGLVEEVNGKTLLPGERERLASNLTKAREKLRLAREALNSPDTQVSPTLRQERREAINVAERRVSRLEHGEPVPDTPFKDTYTVFGLVGLIGLKEAAHADTDLLTWSHSSNRNSQDLANLPLAAAKITYDDALTNGVKKGMKLLGFDVKPEVIDMDGYKHWMIRLTPAMKAAIKKASWPLMAATALLAAPSEAQAQDGSDDAGKTSMIPYLIAAGMVAGSWKVLPREMRARLAARAKAGGYEKKGGVIFHANPIPDAMRALKRAPTTAAVGAIAAMAANSDNPDIRDTAPWVFGLAALHTIGSANLKAGGKVVTKAIVDQLRRTPTGTAVVRLVNPAVLIHPEAQAAILAFEALKSKGSARQMEYTGKLKALGPLGDRIVSDFIEGENFEAEADVKALSSEELHAIVLVAQSAAEEVERGTKMQIDAEALHPGSALPNYLPGKYAYWEALDALTEKAPRGKGSSQNVRISPIKKRTIPREEIEARNKLGEIRESSYRVGVAIEKAYSRSAAAILFKTLRAIPDVIHPEYQTALDDFLVAKDLMRQAKTTNNAADIATAQGMLDAADLKRKNISTRFKLRGGDYVTMPETKSLGVLAGMVVQRDIANELNGLPERRTSDRLMKFWKQAKTVFNPGTHVANIVSNTTLAHMGGMRMTEQPIWLARAGRDMHNYGRGARALAESGQSNLNAVTAGSAGTTARSARSEEGLSELMQTTRPETARVLREVGIRDPKAELTPTFNKAMQATRDLYNDEDNIFRVAMYLKATSPKETKLSLSDANGLGMNHAQALAHVQETFGNFRTRSPLLRAIRGSVAPFILYPVKVLPAFAKNIVDHPLRYLTLVTMWGALNEYSKAEVGEIPEEDKDEQDRKRYGYFFPGLTQLPFASKEGDKATTSLARWTPMSGATDVSQPGVSSSAISPNWPKSLTPSGPLTDIYAKFVNNIDTYQRKPIYSAEKPLKRNLIRALEDVIQVVGPTAAGFHRERIMQDIENEDWDAAKTDMLALLGMRPRYIRPGGQAQRAKYTREDAQTDARREVRRGLDRSKSPEKDERLLKQFDEYMDQIEKNFERRAFPPPR